jgi:hypothetical protein
MGRGSSAEGRGTHRRKGHCGAAAGGVARFFGRRDKHFVALAYDVDFALGIAE